MTKVSDASYALLFHSPFLVTLSHFLCFPFQLELDMAVHLELVFIDSTCG